MLESGAGVDEESTGTSFRDGVPESGRSILEYAGGGLLLTMLSVLDNDDFNKALLRTGALSCTCSLV